MPRFPQPKSYLPQPPSTTPNRGEPRFLDQVANACRLKHLSYRTEQSYVGGESMVTRRHSLRAAVRPTDAVSQRRSIRPTRSPRELPQVRAVPVKPARMIGAAKLRRETEGTRTARSRGSQRRDRARSSDHQLGLNRIVGSDWSVEIDVDARCLDGHDQAISGLAIVPS